MNVIEARFQIVTPMFIAGAEPDKFAELRAPSIKAALRYWYRAIDSEYANHEEFIFGGTGKHSVSLFTLIVANSKLSTKTWVSISDLQYFAFPFNMGDNERRYIPPGEEEYRLKLAFKKKPEEERYRRALIASLWMLGHVGGLGSRSRRGFGTLMLTEVKVTEGDSWDEIHQIPLAHTAATFDDWRRLFSGGLSKITHWFPSQSRSDHLTLSDQSCFHLVSEGYSSWEQALSNAAVNMRDFRNRKQPDYDHVKKHICKHNSDAAAVAPAVVPTHLHNAPERASFGLPLAFRYSSLRYNKIVNGRDRKFMPGTTFEGAQKGKTRGASPIIIRVVNVGGQYHVLYGYFPKRLVDGNRIRDCWGQYGLPNDNLVETYWSQLPAGVSIQW